MKEMKSYSQGDGLSNETLHIHLHKATLNPYYPKRHESLLRSLNNHPDSRTGRIMQLKCSKQDE